MSKPKVPDPQPEEMPPIGLRARMFEIQGWVSLALTIVAFLMLIRAPGMPPFGIRPTAGFLAGGWILALGGIRYGYGLGRAAAVLAILFSFILALPIIKIMLTMRQ